MNETPAVAEPPGQPVFRLRRVSKVYRMGESDIHALREVDLDLRAGEFVVMLGASGSGKSTLLNILGGLDRPSSGEVRYLDHDLAAATPDEPAGREIRSRFVHVWVRDGSGAPWQLLFREARISPPAASAASTPPARAP